MSIQGQPEPASIHDGADQTVSAADPVDNSHLLADAGFLAKANDSSSVPKEVTDSFNLLRKGDLNGFTNYFFNNPDAQDAIKTALADKKIDLYVEHPPVGSSNPLKIALSTEVRGIEPLSRTLVMDGTSPPKADLLYPAGANYEALRSRFLQAGNKIDVGAFTKVIQERLQPPRTPTKSMFG